MEKATRLLNICTIVLIIATGLYIHLTFVQLLSRWSLVLLWSTISILVGFQFENLFHIVRRRLIHPA